MKSEPVIQAADAEDLETATEAGPPATSALRRRLIVAVLVLVALAAAFIVGPGIRATGEPTEATPLDLGTGAPPTGAVTDGGIDENENGYLVAPKRRAEVTVPLALPRERDGQTLLRVWAYGQPGVHTTIRLRAGDGSVRLLGRPGNWVGKTFDISDVPRRGLMLEARSVNRTLTAALFLDRVAVSSVPNSATVSAPPWSVGLLIGLAVLALLAVAGRAARHWPLSLLLGGGAFLMWQSVAEQSLETLSPEAQATLDAVNEASWFGFHDGLLWGAWERLSSLTVQMFHALTPIVGTAPVSVHSAGVFAGLLALAAIYALGNRAAGRVGGVTATIIALASDPFRGAAIAGLSVPVVVLAGALFAYALHACLAEASQAAIVLLAGGITLLTLAEPTFLPGALIALAIVAATCAKRGQRLRVLGTGLLALAILLAPHLASIADQNNGSLLAGMSARATFSRNVEFAGLGHGAPATSAQLARDPYGGKPVSLPGYLFGDHSISQAAGGVLAGGQRALSAYLKNDASGLLGFIAGAVLLLGAVYALILPRLRMLVLLPPVVAAPTLFLVDREGVPELVGGAPIWAALTATGGVLAYALVKLARPVVQAKMPALAAVHERIRSKLPPGMRSAPGR